MRDAKAPSRHTLWLVLLAAAAAFAVGRWRMKSLLSLLYATRGIAVVLFLLAPKTTAVMLVFAAVMAHQVGGFLGGYVFEATGSYDRVWYLDIALAAGAALIHLPIREKRLPPRTVGVAA